MIVEAQDCKNWFKPFSRQMVVVLIHFSLVIPRRFTRALKNRKLPTNKYAPEVHGILYPRDIGMASLGDTG